MEVRIANGWIHNHNIDSSVDETLEGFWGEPGNPIEEIMRSNREGSLL